MSFLWLQPLLLLGAVFVIGPIIAHMIRKKPINKIPFGSFFLLKKLRKNRRRRRRLSDLLLLLLRIGALLAFCAAFALPIVQWPDPNLKQERASRIVVVLDNSLSMDQRPSDTKGNSGSSEALLYKAKEDLSLLIQSFPEQSKVAIVESSYPAQIRSSGFENQQSSLLATLSEISQSERKTDLAGGVRLARQLLAGEGGEIFVYTDEAGSFVSDPLLKEELKLAVEQNVAFVPKVVRFEPASNSIISSAQYGDGMEGGSVIFSVTRYGVGPKKEYTVTVSLPDTTEISTFVEIPQMNEGDDPITVESFVTVPRVTEGGIAKIQIKDLELPLDNAHYFHLPRVGAGRVLVIDGDPGATTLASEVYFLERALAPHGVSGGAVPDVVGSTSLTLLDPEKHRVVFMANVGDPAPLAPELISFVRAGGGLVISVGGNVTPERYNAVLSDLLPAKLRRAEILAHDGSPGVSVNLPDVTHPLFEPFGRKGFSSFSDLRWKRIFTVEPGFPMERQIMSLSSGGALLLERKVGKGRVLLLTGTVDHGWGNFPTQAVFLPLVQRMVSYLGGASTQAKERVSGVVGEQLKLKLPNTGGEVQLLGPSGLVGTQREGDWAIFTPQQAGPYRLQSDSVSTKSTEKIESALIWGTATVNVPDSESDVRHLDELLSIAAEIKPEHFIHKEHLDERLLVLGLVLLLLQAWLAFPKAQDPEGEVQMVGK
ncbi:MAG: hypothetical protein CMK59_04715 [Proteobacteria bacterium]|nr:hypothetical protein [Pseudomonadota bacterium]